MTTSQTITLGAVSTKAYIGYSPKGKRLLVPTGATVKVERTICPQSMFSMNDAGTIVDTAVWIDDGNKVGPLMVDIAGPLTGIRLTAVTANPTVYVAE